MSLVYPNGLTTPPRVTDKFGMRLHPIYDDYRMHYGTDTVDHPEGLNFAPEAGRVSLARPWGGAGNAVWIDSDGNRQWRIFHHAGGGFPLVSLNEYIASRRPTGWTGTTGDSTGVHCHLELLINGSHVDPFAFIAANISAGIPGSANPVFLQEEDDMSNAKPQFYRKTNGAIQNSHFLVIHTVGDKTVGFEFDGRVSMSQAQDIRNQYATWFPSSVADGRGIPFNEVSLVAEVYDQIRAGVDKMMTKPLRPL